MYCAACREVVTTASTSASPSSASRRAVSKGGTPGATRSSPARAEVLRAGDDGHGFPPRMSAASAAALRRTGAEFEQALRRQAERGVAPRRFQPALDEGAEMPGGAHGVAPRPEPHALVAGEAGGDRTSASSRHSARASASCAAFSTPTPRCGRATKAASPSRATGPKAMRSDSRSYTAWSRNCGAFSKGSRKAGGSRSRASRRIAVEVGAPDQVRRDRAVVQASRIVREEVRERLSLVHRVVPKEVVAPVVPLPRTRPRRRPGSR